VSSVIYEFPSKVLILIAVIQLAYWDTGPERTRMSGLKENTDITKYSSVLDFGCESMTLGKKQS
jgi:hypothetical protein